MGASDQFFLKSNNFHEKTGKAFHTFKEGNDFTDVTLVSEDGQEIEVHKIVLAASSSMDHSKTTFQTRKILPMT